ncbi:MAG: PIN domain-containing protein [Candidatus Micrarchaeia archaeon]
MKVTVDANIMFACLIKDSTTRRLFFNPALSLFAPEFIAEELLRHIIEIQRKSGLGEEELHRLIAKVFGQLTLVSDDILQPFLPAAASLINDPKDWLYLSCALYEDTLIWSNDNDFGGQGRIRIVTTKELVDLVGLL